MHHSEFVSIAWIAFFITFAIVSYMFANRERNMQWIERMGAILFAAIVIVSVAGAMAPHFFSSAMHFRWLSNSPINTTATVVSMIIGWLVFAWGLEWLAGLAAASLLFGGLFSLGLYISG